MPDTTNHTGLEKVADVLDDVNLVVGKFIPLIAPFMAMTGTVLRLLKKPNLDPALRTEAIAAMRANFTQIGVNADTWLAEHGYDDQGNPLP